MSHSAKRDSRQAGGLQGLKSKPQGNTEGGVGSGVMVARPPIKDRKKSNVLMLPRVRTELYDKAQPSRAYSPEL